MSYTQFNRHESMNSETREEIMNLIKEVRLYRYDLQKKSKDVNVAASIENSLYGLFDGYLYDSLQLNALKCHPYLAAKIVRIYHICSMYPKSQTKIY